MSSLRIIEMQIIQSTEGFGCLKFNIRNHKGRDSCGCKKTINCFFNLKSLKIMNAAMSRSEKPQREYENPRIKIDDYLNYRVMWNNKKVYALIVLKLISDFILHNKLRWKINIAIVFIFYKAISVSNLLLSKHLNDVMYVISSWFKNNKLLKYPILGVSHIW